jgi:DNA-binding GntR family transcriptional regulator
MPRAADVAYQALRQMILAGDAGAGARLGETEMAELLGLSRTPVREALQRLDSDGLVELMPHRGARVVSWTPGDLEEIFELRGQLEPYGAARAARRGLSPEVLAQLDGLCGQMEACADARDFPRLAELNSRLHGAVIAGSGNGRLADLVKTVIHVPIVIGTFARYDTVSLRRSMGHHRELVAALRARDPAWAEAVMTSHIRAAADFLIEQIRREES